MSVPVIAHAYTEGTPFPATGRFQAVWKMSPGDKSERDNVTEQKTLKELREEAGLGLGDLDDAMEVPPGTTFMLERLRVTYPGLLVVEEGSWVVPYSERFGEAKRFWFAPEEAVSKWREAARIIVALQTVLDIARDKCRDELDGSLELLAQFRRQEELYWRRP